jgi:Arc/MetJ-type ribon-helix-helix transcriptional regulator
VSDLSRMRIPKTLTVDEYILTEVERTKRRGSASERVNELLKRTLDLEQQERLQREAAVFYSEVKDRQEVIAFQNTSRRALAKDNRPHGL